MQDQDDPTFSAIINCHDLSQHLNSLSWVIIDCRFDLMQPEWGRSEYTKVHIPGAVYADLNRDLSAPVTPATGRHPLPREAEMIRLFSGWGIDRRSYVVAYDSANGSVAARLWWMLKACGHNATAILEGGFQAWVNAGLPVSSENETRAPAWFEGRLNHRAYITSEEVAARLHDPTCLLIDARSSPRYRGEEEPIDSEAGHIPAALNRFHGENLTPDGSFLPPDVLRQQFLSLLGGVDPENTVVYCGSGVTSCLHLVAMAHAGLNLPRLYAGSWSEWIRNPNRPRIAGSGK